MKTADPTANKIHINAMKSDHRMDVSRLNEDEMAFASIEDLKKAGFAGYVQADELRKNLDPEIEIIEVDTHINTPEFARAVVSALELCTNDQ